MKKKTKCILLDDSNAIPMVCTETAFTKRKNGEYILTHLYQDSDNLPVIISRVVVSLEHLNNIKKAIERL